jgi:hypothetical protein
MPVQEKSEIANPISVIEMLYSVRPPSPVAQHQERSVVGYATMIDENRFNFFKGYLEASECAEPSNKIGLPLLMLKCGRQVYQVIRVCMDLSSVAVVNKG